MANDIFLRTTLTGTSLLFVLKTLSETKITCRFQKEVPWGSGGRGSAQKPN